MKGNPLKRFFKQSKFILFILTLFIIYSSIKYWQKSQVKENYDNIKKQDCLSKKGQWVTWGKGWFCNNFYNDGGKVCQSGKDCLSEHCLIKENSGVNTGQCASYSVNPGCFDLLSDNGKHTGFSCTSQFSKIETQ